METYCVEAKVTYSVSLCPHAAFTLVGQGLQRTHCVLASAAKPASHSQVQLVSSKNPLVTHDASTGFPLQLLHWASCRSEHRVAVYVPTVAQSVQGEQLEPVENSLSIHCPAARRADFWSDFVATLAGSPARLRCATTEKRAKRIVTNRCNMRIKSAFTCTQCRAVKPPFLFHSLVAATGLEIVSFKIYGETSFLHIDLSSGVLCGLNKYFGGVFGSWLIFECSSSGHGLLATMPVRGLLANIRLSHRLGSFD